MPDPTMADVLRYGAGGVGGNFGTMTPQEAAAAVTPGSVLDAITRRGAQWAGGLAATPGATYAGSGPDRGPSPERPMLSDEDMTRQLLNEAAINRNAFEGASAMIGAGGAPAREAAAGPGHVLGVTRDKFLNAEDWLNERLLDTPLPGSDIAEKIGQFVLGSGSRKAAPIVAAPAIRRESTPLFDYSRLGELPDVPQFALPRAAPARGVPADFQAISPQTVAAADQAVRRGIAPGSAGLPWYNTMPLRDAYSEVLGATEGPQRYRGYINAVGATSPDTIVPSNIRTGSYYDYLLRNQMPLPQRLKNPETGNWFVPPGQIPYPYGARAQALHVQNMQALRDTGELPVLENPKPPSFIQNLLGNYEPVTIDRHNLRLFGLNRSEPGGGYGYLEGLQQAQAAPMGIRPAQYQAGGWLGGQTGVKSPNEPWLKTFEDTIRSTAELKGLTPATVLKQFIREGMPLR